MGTRNYYAIYSASSSFDEHEVTPNFWYISQNRKEALDRFKWLYEEYIRSDFTNDDGEVYADHDLDFISNTKDNLEAFFYFDVEEYRVEYRIKTIKTGAFRSWFRGRRNNTTNEMEEVDSWEMAYQNHLGNNNA